MIAITIVRTGHNGQPTYEPVFREVKSYVDIFKDDVQAEQKTDAGHGSSAGTVTKFSPARV